MQTVVKPIITCLIAIMAITILLTRTNIITDNWTNDELGFALRIATQDATATMMSDDFIFGNEEESNDFNVSLVQASKQFEDTFFKNIGSTLTDMTVNSASVTLSGYAGYKYIYGIYTDGNTTVPYYYSYYKEDENSIYNFTLGDNIYIKDLSTAEETVIDINDLDDYYFSSKITNNNFRTITIMSTINTFLDMFYGDDANVTAINTGSGVKFDLGLVDYAQDDPTVMTQLSAVIDGPSFFAVVDCWDTEINQYVRIMSLGAAESKIKSFEDNIY